MYQQIPNYGIVVKLGLNRNTMYGHQLMLVERPLKDINLKVVNGKKLKRKRNNGTYTTI
jgi:hypothetical protein